MTSTPRPRATLLAFALVMMASNGAMADAPFSSGYLQFRGNTVGASTGSNGPGHAYIEIGHNPALNPTGAVTFEGWLNFETPHPSQTCRSIIGKGFTSTYWIGICGTTLRSYLKGSASVHDAGTVPAGIWTHFAVTFDGTFRRHYINGIEVGEWAETGPLPVNSSAVRIGSDVNWFYTPQGFIEELRLWNVARSVAQIQSTMFGSISAAQAGLVAVWGLNGSANSTVGGFAGTLTGTHAFIPATPAGSYLQSSQVPNFRFKVRITPSGGSSIAGAQEGGCLTETLCVSGAIPGRSEVFLRVVGPRPNGYLWPTFIKFTQSRVEVWVEQLSTGGLEYYDLPAAAGPTDDSLNGLFNRLGFLP